LRSILVWRDALSLRFKEAKSKEASHKIANLYEEKCLASTIQLKKIQSKTSQQQQQQQKEITTQTRGSRARKAN